MITETGRDEHVKPGQIGEKVARFQSSRTDLLINT